VVRVLYAVQQRVTLSNRRHDMRSLTHNSRLKRNTRQPLLDPPRQPLHSGGTAVLHTPLVQRRAIPVIPKLCIPNHLHVGVVCPTLLLNSHTETASTRGALRPKAHAISNRQYFEKRGIWKQTSDQICVLPETQITIGQGDVTNAALAQPCRRMHG
jgi:hypothetical protein